MDIWDQLWAVLHGDERGLLVYVYRIDPQGEVIRPYLVKCEAWPGLLRMLRDQFGGGTFLLLVKSGRELRCAGRIAVVGGAPIR
jgi:hypothetical protein